MPTKISIKVKPNSKKEGIIPNDDGSLTVRVNVPPVEGKANERVVELLAEHFDKPKSKITLVSGHKSKIKIFQID